MPRAKILRFDARDSDRISPAQQAHLEKLHTRLPEILNDILGKAECDQLVLAGADCREKRVENGRVGAREFEASENVGSIKAIAVTAD
jgi:hypothetical protein